MCSGCGQEQSATAKCFILFDHNGGVIGRFCAECWAGMAGHEQVERVSLAEAEARAAAVQDARLQAKLDARRRRMRDEREALRRREYDARQQEERRRLLEQQAEVRRANELWRRQVAVERNPQKHTCPTCERASYGMAEHEPGCEHQMVPLLDDLMDQNNPRDWPQAWLHWNRSGELVIAGRVTHHRPLDMSRADIFGDGHDDEAA